MSTSATEDALSASVARSADFQKQHDNVTAQIQALQGQQQELARELQEEAELQATLRSALP